MLKTEENVPVLLIFFLRSKLHRSEIKLLLPISQIAQNSSAKLISVKLRCGQIFTVPCFGLEL